MEAGKVWERARRRIARKMKWEEKKEKEEAEILGGQPGHRREKILFSQESGHVTDASARYDLENLYPFLHTSPPVCQFAQKYRER
jgi:hypothetical protein